MENRGNKIRVPIENGQKENYLIFVGLIVVFWLIVLGLAFLTPLGKVPVEPSDPQSETCQQPFGCLFE